VTATPPVPAAGAAAGTGTPFHGWRIVTYASIVVAMTAPGQTAGVSPFIDPMMAELGLSRSAVSTTYLIGTLTGAACLPLVGRLVDRHGSRAAMVVIGGVFGAVLIGLSLVSGIVGLTAGFVGIRLAGQGALGLAAVTVVAHWFTRRRGTALGIVSAFGSAGISLAPILIERLIAFHGWRTVWLIEGLAVWAIVIPIALLGIRNRPADVGQHIDGQPAPRAGHQPPAGATRGVALRTPYFWVLAGGVSTSGLLGTAVVFHQISLLGARGLTPAQAAAVFIPMTAAGLAATLLVGYLIDRLDRPRLLVVTSMCLLALSLAWATVATPGWSAWAYGALMGAASNAIRALEAALTPRMFGTDHLGAIRGVMTALSVASTAAGPLIFALVYDATGSYTAILLASLALPLAVAIAALTTGLPTAEPPVTPHQAGRGST
jgi:MFS family permease